MSSVNVKNMTAEQFKQHDRYLELGYKVCAWLTVPVILSVVWLLATY